MNDTTPVNRWQRRREELLDGENRWGFARVQSDRFGVTRYRLVVYPPGISDTERRRLRVWRGSPIWGAAFWIVLEIVLHPLIGALPALAISTATVVVLAVVALAKTGDIRTRVRGMSAVTMVGYTGALDLTARDSLIRMATALREADERVDEKRMSPLDHEALWWQVYEQLAPKREDVPT